MNVTQRGQPLPRLLSFRLGGSGEHLTLKIKQEGMWHTIDLPLTPGGAALHCVSHWGHVVFLRGERHWTDAQGAQTTEPLILACRPAVMGALAKAVWGWVPTFTPEGVQASLRAA